MIKIVLAVLMTVWANKPVEEIDPREKYEVWFEVCDYTPYGCYGVKLPRVQIEQMHSRLRGYYRGDDVVHISRDLVGEQRRATLHHEMVHYLQATVGKRTYESAKDVCEDEAEAFKLTDERWVRLGHPEEQRGDMWWTSYIHCWPFYAPANEPEGAVPQKPFK